MNAARGAERVELVGLGRCGLVADGREIPVILAQPKRFGLLAYLTLARPRGLHQRDTLLALLWPELPEKNARQALAQSLYFLKRSLGRKVLTRSGRSLVGVSPHVSSDVERFEDFLGRDELERALALYGGDLLPGLHVTGCRQFESWLEAERSRLRDRAIEAAVLQAAHCEEQGEADEAVHWARWAVRQQPYGEFAVTCLLKTLAGVGDLQGLRTAYQDYAQTLRDELDAAVPERILRLYERAEDQANRVPTAPIQYNHASAPEPTPGVDGGKGRRSPLGLALGTALTVAAAGLALVVARPDAPAADTRRVVVLPLETAGEAPELREFSRIAADWVAREIARTGVAEVIAPRAASTNDDSSGGGARVGDSLGVGVESGLVVSGLVFSRGDTLVIDGAISEAASGRVVVKLPEIAGEDDNPMAVAEMFGRRVAGGLSTALDPRFGRWAELASQPPSVEAYRHFLDGLDAFAAGEPDSADAYFFAAAREDPDFTAPLIWAVRNRANAHRGQAADSLAQALQSRRDELAPWDRAVLDYYTAYLRGTWEEAYQAARTVAYLAPDPEWTQLLASAAHAANRLEEAKAALGRLEFDSGWTREWPFRWRTWTMLHHALGEFEAELAAAEPHRGEHPVTVGMTELGAYAGLGRLVDFERTLDVLMDMMRSPAAQVRLLEGAVGELRAHGYEAAARPLAEQAVGLSETLAHRAEATGRDTLEYGRMLYLADRWDQAHTVLSSISAEADVNPGRWLTSLGLAAARSGRELEARRIAAGLLDDDPLGQGHATQQAAVILAALGEQAEATAMLRRAFDEGFGHYPWLHTVREFHALRGYEPFDAMMEPR